MEYQFAKTEEVTSEAISLFERPSVDTSVSKVSCREYRPLGQITEGSPITFNVVGSSGEYLEPKKMKLRIKLKIVKEDGKAVTESDKVAFVNLTAHSLFRQVDVKIQQKLVTSTVGTNYPYKAMMDVLFKDVEATENELFMMDEAGCMDGIVEGNDANAGLIFRWQRTKDGQELLLETSLLVDILQQDKLLLDGVALDVQLFPNTNAFVLMSAAGSENYKAKITDAALRMPVYIMSPGVLLGHADALKENNALYPFMRSEVKAFNIAQGSHTWTMDNIFQDTVPSKLVVALVSEAAYSGHYQKNPFNFANMNLNYLDFLVQGQSTRGQPYQPDYDKGQYADVYTVINEGKEQEEYRYVEYSQIPKGFALYVFEIDRENSFPVVRKGHTRLVMKLGQALSEATTVLVYGRFPAMMEIDSARNVTVQDP
jgi:hypothetical protein